MATNTEKIVVQVVVQGQKQLQNLESQTNKTTLGFNKMTAGIVGAVAAYRQINKLVSSSIRTFRDFEFQMAKVKAITGASEKDFKQLSETAKELGRSTFFTAQQVAELQTNFGKLGFSTTEILKAQEATLLLATATDTDLARAATVAGAAVRGFALDADETGRVVDVMAVAFTKSALDIEKFQTSMTKVAPIAAGANISLESTTAIMGTLTDAGIEASIAGTSLRNIFLKMQDPTEELTKHLGFTVNSSEDLQRALTQLNEEGLSNERIMQLVDLRQVAAFQTMVKGSNRVEELTRKLLQANGAAADMAFTVGDTLEGAFKRFTSATQGLQIELSQELGTSLKEIIDKLALFINKITDNSEAIAKTIKGLVFLIKWLGIYKIGAIATTVATNALAFAMVSYRTAAFTAAAATQAFSLAVKSFLVSTGVGVAVVMLTELAAKFLLVDENASNAAEAIADIEKEEARLIKHKDKFNKLINSELATTKEQAKVNIEKTNAAIDNAKRSIQAAKDGWKMGLITVELLEEEIKLYKDKLQVQEANEKQLKTEEDRVNRVINSEKNRFSSLIKLQLDYIDTLDAIDSDSLEERLIKQSALEENFRLQQLEIQKLFLTEQMSNLEIGSTERLDLEMQFNQLILDEDQRVLDRKLGMMSQEKQAKIDLENAKANATIGYVRLAQGMAKEGSELAMALFIFEKVLAAQQVFIAGTQEIAAINLAKGIYLARPDNALLGIAGIAKANAVFGAQIAASKLMTGLSMAAILASTIQGLGKKAKGGMIEEFANGGMVHGNSHAQGGEKFAVGGRVVELEGGEAVINKRSTSMFRNQLSAMNSAGGGVKFADGGLMNMPSFAQSQFNVAGQAGMMGAMGQGSRVVVVESDITTSQNTVSVIEAEATI
jgi:TP901 family phage tail tape measure protein